MYRNRPLLLTAVVFLLCAECVTGQTPSPPGGREAVFTMRISLKEATVKPGSPVTLDVAITNTSNREIGVASWAEPYTFDIVDRSGKSAPLTRKGRVILKRERIVENGKIHMRLGGSSWTIRIPSGGSAHDKVLLTEFFALSEPGQYEIRLHRPDTETNQLVTSNTVTLTVASDSRPNEPGR